MNDLQGHSRSLPLLPFDRPYTISVNFQLFVSVYPSCTVFEILTLSLPIPLRFYALPYWSHPPFNFDIWALWRSELSVRAPKYQKLKMVG